jgi:hypothetical protein
MGPKIDVMEREWKKFNFLSASKRGPNKKKKTIRTDDWTLEDESRLTMET